MQALLASVSWATGFAGDFLREPRGLFALGAIALLVIYGFSVGRTRALVSLLAIYVAYVLAVLFPFTGWLRGRVPESAQGMLGLVVFLVLYLAVFFAFSRSMSHARLARRELSLFQLLLISVVQVGLLASIAVSLAPPSYGERLFGPLQPAVAGRYALWAWAAASLAMLPLLRTRRRD